MRSARGKANRSKLAWIGALALLLILLPSTIQAEVKGPISDLKVRLPELQKAVGKDWSVSALSGGYLLTYLPLVSFYPAISESSKVTEHQRIEHGRMEHLQIRIAEILPLSEQDAKNPTVFNAYWSEATRGEPGFYGCGDADWVMYQYVSVGKGLVVVNLFSCNVPPNAWLAASTEEMYEHTLDRLAPLFHALRGPCPIED